MNKSTEKLTQKSGLKYLYLISFIEGGVVMVAEISGARLLTPYFGASLYSWASTLSITLLALMSGYYYGGYLTTKPSFSSINKIFWIFFFSGLSVLLMPSIGHFIMERTLSFSFFVGLVFSELFYLFLPIFLMGTISPMIIFQITQKAELSGRSSGNIYALSTSGGILFTLIFGFIIIPNYGISQPLHLLGAAVCSLALGILYLTKKSKKILPLVIAALFLFAAYIIGAIKNPALLLPKNMQMQEYSEGLLGELKVIDYLSELPNGEQVKLRKLKINNIQQNYVFADMPTQSLLFYVNFSKQLINYFPEKESALLIGLGAGSLYKILKDKYKHVETVEIDKRIYDMGLKYFDMAAHEKENAIMDGRYFINVTNKKYDLIVLDVIIGENVPAQLITLESFKRLHELLNPNGVLLVEQGGVGSFSDNAFIPAIDKTLRASGFNVCMFNPLASDTHGDILFLATKDKFDMSSRTIKDDVFMSGGPLKKFELSLSVFDQKQVDVFTDDKNNVDLLLKSHYFGVRKGIRKEMSKDLSGRHS